MTKHKRPGRPKLSKAESRKPITIRLPNDIHQFLDRHEDEKTTIIESCIRECYPEEFKQ